MRKNIFSLIFFIAVLLVSEQAYSEKYKYDNPYNIHTKKVTAEACTPATGKTDLDINNVRARINTGGDMWWDLQNVPKYEIPKGSQKTAMFSAALWIAGEDVNGQLKCAAQRYRQVGIDYWTGPLTIDGSASITSDVCNQYDRHFVITKGEVEQFKAWFKDKAKYPEYEVPKSIKEWPGNGDVSKGQCFYLAPYVSADGSGSAYNWENGDYPYYDFDNVLCKSKQSTPSCIEGQIEGGTGILADQVLKGDQTIWWVFNDKGNIHTETSGAAIGMEIRAQAFAFTTNDEINNMTFYSYELINRSTFKLNETYFSQWVDSDVGYGWDDFVGCDVERGLGYTYNGKEIDGSGEITSYGEHPPAAGVDFFQGPYLDADGYDNPSYKGNGIAGPSFHGKCEIVDFNNQIITMKYGKGGAKDSIFLVKAEAINGVNFGDGIKDNERFGMRRFVYHHNSGGVRGDPTTAIKYYNLLKGIWGDNTKMQYGKNAHFSSGAYGPECDFMFPGDTDPCNWGTNGKNPNGPKFWSEETANNTPYDRRFMQSAGPFTLEPGAVNYITVGVPWARSLSGGPWQSVELLRTVDDKCQRLFDNCFKVLDGPDAPDLVIQEMDKKLILYITNNKISNNYNEEYWEWDPQIVTPDTLMKKGISFDSLYRFEGYQIFQMRDATASVTDITNSDKARLVAQCDIRNYQDGMTSSPISRLINYNFDQTTGGTIPEIMVDGENKGIRHSFEVEYDLFAKGDKKLVNNKQYYFIAIAYAHNEYMKYSADASSQLEPTKGSRGSGINGQKLVYLPGRKAPGGQAITYVVGIPHMNNPEFNGVFSNSKYGDMPSVSRIEGQGNGGNVIELSKETITKILNSPNSKTDTITYIKGKSPVNIKVIDPLTVVNANYKLVFDSIINDPNDENRILDAWWKLYNLDTKQLVAKSDKSIRIANEQILLDLGLSITIGQVRNPGSNSTLDANGYLNPSINDKDFKEIEYADSTKGWLTGVPSYNQNTAWHWIRSGTLVDPNNSMYNSYHYSGVGKGRGLDDFQYYEKVMQGFWAPYALCSKYKISDRGGLGFGPAWNDPHVMSDSLKQEQDPITGKEIWIKNPNYITYGNKLSNLASVDLVFTSDQSKWTRCVVVETSDEAILAEGNVDKFGIRAGASMGKDGKPDGTGNGMSWFPGYAINIETGERLNIIFGENSWLVGDNGRDMLFNPTTRYVTPNSFDLIESIIWGGMHYVYIMGHNGNTANDVPAYDEGKYIYNKLKAGDVNSKRNVWKDAMWVGMPMPIEGREWLGTDAKLRFRVSKSYKKYFAANGDGHLNPQNNNYPAYIFSTGDMFVKKDQTEIAKSALDLINVVPNPYYSYAAFEKNQIDTRVRITNLPEKCVITIYDLSGSIIRQFKVDKSGINSLKTVGDLDFKTSIDWDLKNHAGIPISSGLYLIHVKSEGLGERVIKWFGTIRPIDVTAF